jgi:hypothetical protein
MYWTDQRERGIVEGLYFLTIFLEWWRLSIFAAGRNPVVCGFAFLTGKQVPHRSFRPIRNDKKFRCSPWLEEGKAFDRGGRGEELKRTRRKADAEKSGRREKRTRRKADAEQSGRGEKQS